VFFAGVAIVPNLPVIAELAAAVDVPVVALVIGMLTRRIYARLGTTSVGQLASLRDC
jgi:hydrogenase-4 membrane subunit HyfE